jgi:hypothetical protein
MDTLPKNSAERKLFWLAIAKNHPPEWLAAYIEAPNAPWVVVTENGPTIQRQRSTAYLLRWQEAPYWAYALAKSYLDDVGEWPLAGIKTELVLARYEELLQQEQKETMALAQETTQEILATVKQVWPELDVIYSGEEQS